MQYLKNMVDVKKFNSLPYIQNTAHAGIAQSGCWGCFDEFNRINIEVLSVVAQQILAVLLALSLNMKRFVFEGADIKLDGNCGIFITMNPG